MGIVGMRVGNGNNKWASVDMCVQPCFMTKISITLQKQFTVLESQESKASFQIYHYLNISENTINIMYSFP